MGLLRLPGPFDFELSTERFRAFGPDLANLWADGALHRVVGRREVRIEPARRSVRVEPLDAETRPVVRKLLGAEFDLQPFYAWARRDPVLRRLTKLAKGLDDGEYAYSWLEERVPAAGDADEDPAGVTSHF